MVPVFLASVIPFAGKNVVALGMARKFQSRGKIVGYFKPIGPLAQHDGTQMTDEDAAFFKRILDLQEPLETLCPFVLSDENLAQLLRGTAVRVKDRILTAFRAAARDKDVVITVNMGRLSCGLSFGYPMHEFIREVNARVVVVDRFRWPVETLDGILHIKNLVPDHFAGVVFNRIPASKANHIEQAVRPFLQSHDVPFLGIIPEDTTLGAVPVGDLVESLDGRVLCGSAQLDSLVERFSIGAMNADAALRTFRRIRNKAVITGGDRADIQLAALQTSTRCLVLTGDLYPNERILTRAEEQGVPVVLCSHDTSATVEICDHLAGHLSLQSERKSARAAELVDQCLDWETLYRDLGLE